MNLRMIKDDWKLLFSLLMIGLGVLLFVVVLIKQPMKKGMTPLFNDGKEVLVKKVFFPIEQEITISADKLTGFWLYLDDDSINKYDYDVKLVDENDNIYFDNKFNDYKSNIIYMGIGLLENSVDKKLKLIIDCDSCNKVKMAVALDNRDNEVLKLYEESYVDNSNIYYWHAFLSIVIGLVLLPLAKEERNEKV